MNRTRELNTDPFFLALTELALLEQPYAPEEAAKALRICQSEVSPREFQIRKQHMGPRSGPQNRGLTAEIFRRNSLQSG
jgi:hypothetical protein